MASQRDERVDLSCFDNRWYSPGRGRVWRALWYLANVVLLRSYLLPASAPKRALLRLFGAKVGKAVVIKPAVNIKYPWNLEIGDYTWVGEGVWIDSLARVTIGPNVCLSQGAYLCCGNHDWTDPAFGLVVKPIRIEEGVWVGARATVMPGAALASHCVISAGSVISKGTQSWGVYVGVPAEFVKERRLSPAKTGEASESQ